MTFPFPIIPRALVQTLIPGATGTPIGDMTDAGGLAAAFDGNESQIYTAAARKDGSHQVAYIGKDWGAGVTKTLTGFRAVGAAADAVGGFHWDTPNITITLQGSTDNFSSSVVDLGSVGPTADSDGLVMQKLTGITATAAYRYHRLKIEADASPNNMMCAEAKFYEDA